jgi:hypothetical protein
LESVQSTLLTQEWRKSSWGSGSCVAWPSVAPAFADVRFRRYSVEKVLSEKQTRMRVACFSFFRVRESIPRISHTRYLGGKKHARLGTDFINRIDAEADISSAKENPP